jgi:hypothetical protein
MFNNWVTERDFLIFIGFHIYLYLILFLIFYRQCMWCKFDTDLYYKRGAKVAFRIDTRSFRWEHLDDVYYTARVRYATGRSFHLRVIDELPDDVRARGRDLFDNPQEYIISSGEEKPYPYYPENHKSLRWSLVLIMGLLWFFTIPLIIWACIMGIKDSRRR